MIEKDTNGKKSLQEQLIPVVISALLSTIAWQWMIGIPLLFSLPLFFLYFIKKEKGFSLSVLLSIVFVCIFTVFKQIISSNPLNWAEILYSQLVYICLSSSLLWLDRRIIPKIRLRYRLMLMGISPALFLMPFLVFSHAKEEMIAMMYSLIESLVTEISKASGNALIQDGIDSIFTYIMTLMLNGYTVSFVCMYVFSWLLSACIAFLPRKKLPESLKLDTYYNEKWLIIPLFVGIIGIIIGLISDNAFISIICWNMTLCTSFLFLIQGIAIVNCIIAKLFKQLKSFRIAIFLLLCLITVSFMHIVVCFLVIIAVIEFWIPIRQKINFTDPTPGNGK